VGGGRPIKVDVRILAATNKELERAVREGQFREDLYFRLNVIEFPMPPLREHPGDVIPLARHFAALQRRRSGQVAPEWSDAAVDYLVRHRWPGNVRELANIVERLSILHAGQPIGAPEVVKLGHVVMELADFQATCGWYTRHFGFIPSDVQVLPDGSPVVTFMRLNLGDVPADHHTLALAQGLVAGYSHSAFELVDADGAALAVQYVRQSQYISGRAPTTVTLALADKPGAAAASLRRGWLGV